MPTAKRRNSGFTLVEVMVAMLILFISMMAALWALTYSIEHNLETLMLDEAVKIGEQQMTALRSLKFSDLATSTAATEVKITRNFRNFGVLYTVTWNVQNLSTDNSRAIQVLVSWTHKGRKHEHSISTIVSIDV